MAFEAQTPDDLRRCLARRSIAASREPLRDERQVTSERPVLPGVLFGLEPAEQ